jgi:hypothetical protein
MEDAMATEIGDLYFYDTSLAGGAVATAVAPATNVNGVVIKTMTLGTNVLFADTSAPTSVNDLTKRPVGGSGGFFPMPLKIPAGNGLYVAATGGFSAVSFTYHIL